MSGSINATLREQGSWQLPAKRFGDKYTYAVTIEVTPDASLLSKSDLIHAIKEAINWELAAQFRASRSTAAFYIINRFLTDIIGNAIDARRDDTVTISIEFHSDIECHSIAEAAEHAQHIEIYDTGKGFPKAVGHEMHPYTTHFKSLLKTAKHKEVESGGEHSALRLMNSMAYSFSGQAKFLIGSHIILGKTLGARFILDIPTRKLARDATEWGYIAEGARVTTENTYHFDDEQEYASEESKDEDVESVTLSLPAFFGAHRKMGASPSSTLSDAASTRAPSPHHDLSPASAPDMRISHF